MYSYLKTYFVHFIQKNRCVDAFVLKTMQPFLCDVREKMQEVLGPNFLHEFKKFLNFFDAIAWFFELWWKTACFKKIDV